MNYHFICYGKNINNLIISAKEKIIGSFNKGLTNNLEDGDTLFLYSRGHLFGYSKAVGKGFEANDRLWPDKVYQFRYKTEDFKFLKNPVKLTHTPIHKEILAKYGPHWVYKVLLFPKSLEHKIGTEILRFLNSFEQFENCDENFLKEYIKDFQDLGLSKKQIQSRKNLGELRS